VTSLTEKQKRNYWNKVDIPATSDGCWLWTGAITDNGRGRFKLNGKTQRAHRVAWFLHTGRWPLANIERTCGNMLCVNPNHLRATDSHIKLDKSLADEIKVLLGYFTFTAKEIAAKYNVCTATVYFIGRGETWKDVA
jgi:hypothetical protein